MPDSDDDKTWEPTNVGRRSKRIKLIVRPPRETSVAKSIFTSVFEETPVLEVDDFEKLWPKDEYVSVRYKHLKEASERDIYNNQIRPLTVEEIYALRTWLESSAVAGRQAWSFGESILKRKLILRQIRKVESPVFSYDLQTLKAKESELHASDPLPCRSAPNKEILDALHSIARTPYTSSFAFRLLGHQENTEERNLIHRDWKTQSPWMTLMTDIKLHYALMNPKLELAEDAAAPIDYVTLQRWHLNQVHDLLSATFWPGIDVSDSLRFSPERCNVIATYKRLVVGVALLNSPEETYLTYLAVRPGWESVNIASIMLYLLIQANPKRDVTLHVSANNPAMLLYNKFGFKSEEFIVGFYEDYLPRQSKACKNAFRLRLRG